jgi:hypothetical protein
MRLLMMNMRSPEFVALQPEIQNAHIRVLANIVNREFTSARDKLLPKLRALADESVFKAIRRKGQ